MNNIIEQLGFKGNLLDVNEIIMKYPNYGDITSLGADQCYFISGHPAALFCKTDCWKVSRSSSYLPISTLSMMHSSRTWTLCLLETCSTSTSR